VEQASLQPGWNNNKLMDDDSGENENDMLNRTNVKEMGKEKANDKKTTSKITKVMSSSSLLANSSVERCHTDDLMPNIPISCFHPSRVDSEVQGLKVIIDCLQPGSSWVTYRPPPISRWSKCGGNDIVMVLHGSGMSKVSRETQLE